MTHDRDDGRSGDDIGTRIRPTARQREVLKGVTSGLTAREVARCLGISSRTVEGHLRVLRQATGTRSMGELCALSVAKGWVTPGPQELSAPSALGTPGTPGTLSALETPSAPGTARSCSETQEFPNKLASIGRNRSHHAVRRGGRPTVMTPQRIKAARALLETHTIKETASRLSISRGTLYAHMDVIMPDTWT